MVSQDYLKNFGKEMWYIFYHNYNAIVKILREIGLYEATKLTNKNLLLVQKFNYLGIKVDEK